MRIAFLLAVMLGMSGPASAVVGDLNRDGVVDLEDFFVFADNFGETGQPEFSDCIVTGPLVDDGSVIPDLLSVTINAGSGPHNWDADPEGEGMIVHWALYNTDLRLIGSSQIPETVVHKLTISYWAIDSQVGIKMHDEPFWVLEFETLATARERRVPFEEYAAFVPEEYIRGYEHIGLYVSAVAELVLTQADGSSFEARDHPFLWLNTW